MIALLRDGFNAESEGGKIELSNDGSPIIDYKVNDYLWDGVVRSWLSMAEMQFAAGAKATRVSHVDSPWFHSWEEAKAGIPKLEFRSNAYKIGRDTSELQSRPHLVCRLLLEKKKNRK